MKIFLSNNPYKEFLHISQSDEKTTKYACTFYAPVINLAYNCGIKLSENDIKNIISEQKGRGVYFPEKGGKLEDGVNAVYSYLKNHAQYSGWRIPILCRFKKTEKTVDKLLKKGYSFIVGFGVNKKFYDDVSDGKIEVYDDYKHYVGKYFKHSVNLLEKDEKGYLLESIAYGQQNIRWLIEADLVEMKEDLIHDYIYLFL